MICSSGIGDSPTYVLWIVIFAMLLMLSTHYRERPIAVGVLGGFNRLEISRQNYINFGDTIDFSMRTDLRGDLPAAVARPCFPIPCWAWRVSLASGHATLAIWRSFVRPV